MSSRPAFVRAPGAPHVDVALVVAVFNEAEYIERCLRHLVDLDVGGLDVRVLVYDGGSTDATRDIVNSMSSSYPQITLLDNPAKIASAAFNSGFHSVEAAFYGIVGGHCALSKDYLKVALKVLAERPEVGVVGGILENRYEDEESKAIGFAMSSRLGVGTAAFRTGAGAGEVDTVAFGVYRREVVKQVGDFDLDLVRNQDDEYNFRVRKAGWQIFLEQTMRAEYFVRGSALKAFLQYREYGYWKVRVNVKHGQVTSLRQLVPAGLIAYLAVGIPATVLGYLFTPWAALLGLPAIVYVIAMLASSGRSDSPFRVLRAYAALHFGYGIGYWAGLRDFVLGRRSAARSSYTRGSR